MASGSRHSGSSSRISEGLLRVRTWQNPQGCAGDGEELELLSEGEEGIEGLLEGAPEELTKEGLQLEQECVADEEAREKENAEEQKKKRRKRIPKKIHSGGLSGSFCRPFTSSLEFAVMDPNTQRPP